MDVEFIYDPKQDAISIVQARPIPAGEASRVIPCSVPPATMPILKQAIKDGQIKKCNAQVITPAGFAAKIITQANEVLVCDTIEEALTVYLKQKNSPVKVVIVRNMAPATAHEAAQFNSKAIPVFQVDDLSVIRQWLKTNKSVVMVDPQRNQILNFTQIIQDPQQAKAELEQKEYLEDGLFTLPTSPQTSKPLFIKKKTSASATEPSSLGGLIQQDLGKVVESLYRTDAVTGLEKHHIYTQLLSQIETLEAVNSGQNNQDVLTALNTVRHIFYRIAKAEGAVMTFFQPAMVLCEEIERSIKRYSAATVDTNLQALREEHLGLVAKLKSFVSSSGHQSTFSNSILQTMQEKQSRKLVAEASQGFDAEQTGYLTQFLKLTKVGFNDESKQRWTDFVKMCLNDTESIQKLAAIVKFYVEH